jgi:hypothetical protein
MALILLSTHFLINSRFVFQSRQGCTLDDQICLVLAVVLLQSIGLVKPRPDQRALTSMYHENLVMVRNLFIAIPGGVPGAHHAPYFL